MRSAALFALFGFVAAMVSALGKEQPLETTFSSGFRWAIGFGLLGWGIGWVARLIAGEVVPKSGASTSAAADPTDKRNEEAWVRPDRRPQGNTPSLGATGDPETAEPTATTPSHSEEEKASAAPVAAGETRRGNGVE